VDKLVALQSIVADLGARVVTVRSGTEALRRLLEQDFAVILLDVRMPGLDGFETAALIRRRPRSEDTPIIFVTAFQDETHAARGCSLKAVDYMQRPVVPDVLRTKVAVFVELFAMTAEAKRQAACVARRAAQLHRLANASLAINRSGSFHDVIELTAESAREI